MQNATSAETNKVTSVTDDLQNEEYNSDISPQVKSYILGLNLMNIVGDDVLEDAVSRIKPLVGTPSRDSSMGEPNGVSETEPTSLANATPDQPEADEPPSGGTTKE